MLIVALNCIPLLLSCSCTLMNCSSSAMKKKILREVKYAPTNLAASMCKLTFKHNLTHFVTLMKDTVNSEFIRGVCVKRELGV